MEHTHFVSVAGLVLNDKDEVLLIDNPRRGWEYPGGMVEPGESLHDALVREIQEESGVKVETIGFVGVCKNVQKDVVNLDFVCRYVSGELTPSEESIEVRWVKKEDISKLITYPLTKIRMKNMLEGEDKVICFEFTREPFAVLSKEELPVGSLKK